MSSNKAINSGFAYLACIVRLKLSPQLMMKK